MKPHLHFLFFYLNLWELSKGELQVVHGLPDQHEDDEVGDEERGAPVPVSKLRESPDVADAHAEPDAGEDELPLWSPVLSGLVTALRVRLGESWKGKLLFFVRKNIKLFCQVWCNGFLLGVPIRKANK